jgi:uroporphyrinogen III methyltransferase/synthase
MTRGDGGLSGPLSGRRIIITRAREQARRFRRLLEAAGAEVLEIPTIRIEAPASWEPLDRALDELEGFTWVIFTSANGVRSVRRRLGSRGKDRGALRGLRVAAIGPATRAALEDWGVSPDVVPDEYRAEGLVSRLAGVIRPGEGVLLPRAAETRDLLVTELLRLGARVSEVPAYRTVPAIESASALRHVLKAGRIDVVAFTSSSTVKNFAMMLPERERSALLKDVMVASIGPVTAGTAAEFGLETRIMPSEYTIPALARAIIDHYTGGKAP